MPLSFQYEKIVNHEQFLVPWHERHGGDGSIDRPVPGVLLETVILLCAPMGVQSITEKNYAEVWARVDIMQRIHGAFMHRAPDESKDERGRQEVYITVDDIIAFIGLSCNVGTITRAQFIKNVVAAHMSDIERSAIRRRKEMETELVEKIKTKVLPANVPAA